MFKTTSNNSQYRLRPKDTYSSGYARRLSFYAAVLYANREVFDPYRQGRICKVWAEIERDGELDNELPWLRDTFLPWLGTADREKLATLYDIATMGDPDD